MPDGSDVISSNIRAKSMLAYKSLPSPGISCGTKDFVKWLDVLSNELFERAAIDFRLYARTPKTISEP